jgi:hypothetical protein
MSIDWWSLRGPQDLVSRLCSELRVGKNVFLSVPEHFPYGFRSAVQESRDLRELHWHHLSIDPDEDRDPLDVLWEEFVFEDEHPGLRRSVEQLLEKDSFSGMIIWVDGLTPHYASRWIAFIERFSQTINSIPVFMRFQICCVVPRAIASRATANICCAVVDAVPHAGLLDTLTYADALTQGRSANPLEAHVMTSVVANITLWDQELAVALSHQSIDVILSPGPWLRQWAERKLWSKDLTLERFSEMGLRMMFESQVRLHSAIVALKGDTAEISSRVWRGQVSVLLPFIEERRRDLLGCVGHLVALPFRTSYGDITELSEVEIGHLHNLMCRSYGVDPQIQELIRLLRDIRNRLAHFSPIDCGVLSRRELREYQSILKTSSGVGT